MLKALRHENVVRLLDAFRRQDRLHLVFEFVEGTVLEALQRAPSGLGYSCTRRLIWQLIRAVEHLHTHQVSCDGCWQPPDSGQCGPRARQALLLYKTCVEHDTQRQWCLTLWSCRTAES